MNKVSLLVAFVIGAVLADAYLIGVNVLLAQTTATTTISYNGSGTLSAYQQLQNARSYGLNLSISYFSCNASVTCEKVRIAPCDNNLPSQSACINAADYSAYQQDYKASMHPTICPLYFVEGLISCSCDYSAHSCVEHYTPA